MLAKVNGGNNYDQIKKLCFVQPDRGKIQPKMSTSDLHLFGFYCWICTCLLQYFWMDFCVTWYRLMFWFVSLHNAFHIQHWLKALKPILS